MQGSKIRLSPAEAALFCNADIILTKNSVLQKTVALLSEVQAHLPASVPSGFPEQSPSPKISRGENYLGLPYALLDYPRIAAGSDLLFIRSMFWWGNFYSSTLQLAGSYRTRSRRQIVDAFDLLATRNYFVGVRQDPWSHHFEPDNYHPISQMSKKAFSVVLEETPHTKIAARWPLTEWELAASNLFESWKLLTGLIA